MCITTFNFHKKPIFFFLFICFNLINTGLTSAQQQSQESCSRMLAITPTFLSLFGSRISQDQLPAGTLIFFSQRTTEKEQFVV